MVCTIHVKIVYYWGSTIGAGRFDEVIVTVSLTFLGKVSLEMANLIRTLKCLLLVRRKQRMTFFSISKIAKVP